MAFDKIVDSAALDSRLSALADRIRAKGKTTAKLCFEKGDYEKAVDAIRLGYFPTLHVTAPAGSSVTVTDGKTSFHGTGTGTPAAFELPNLGTWTVKAARGSEVEEKSVIVDEARSYRVALYFGVLVSTLPIGSIIKTKVNGEAWEWLIVHQGKPSAMYDESCNGTWILMKDIYSESKFGVSNDYEASLVNSYLNNAFLALLEPNVRNAIQQVKIPYRKGAGEDPDISSGANGLATKIFALSGYELGWTSNDIYTMPPDGAKLAHFESGEGSAAKNKRIANRKGTPAIWWTRSPVCARGDGIDMHYSVYENGGYYRDFRDNVRGIRPAMVLKGSTLIDENRNIKY